MLTLAPKSQRALSMTWLPVTHGMENLLGYFSLGVILFWMIALYSSISVKVLSSWIFFLFVKISLAYEGI